MDNADQVNNVDASELLPHLKPMELIEQLYPRMIAPDAIDDCEVVSQAELWVVTG